MREPAGAPKTSQLDNATSLFRLPKRKLLLGFLPYSLFPRIGDWSALRGTAYIHHLIGDGSLGEQYAYAFGALPFRGHRQRLDRYDETDFETYVAAPVSLLTPTPTPTPAPTPNPNPSP